VTPDEVIEQAGGAQFVVAVLMRDALKQALLAIDLPTRASGVRWSPKRRAWLNRAGKVSENHETYFPYTEYAKKIDLQDAPGEFLVVTFTRNSVGIVRSVLGLKNGT